MKMELYRDTVSWNDEYDIAEWRQTVQEKQQDANGLLIEIASALLKTEESADDTADDVKYIVEINQEMKEAIRSGKIKFDVNKKTGEMYAQLRKANGHYGEKLSIKEELSTPVASDDVTLALQVQALEEKLINIIEALEEIGDSVIELLQGQQNDRIGLYYSGQNLYFESRAISDPTLRKYMVAQALKTLSDANAQMVQNIKSDIQYLVEKRYKDKKGKGLQSIDEKMLDINKSFAVIHRSSILRAAIYHEQNEFDAMLSVMESYGIFLEKIIAPYAPKLMEYDAKDIFLRDGIWEKRAGAFEEIKEMRNQISVEKIFCLEEDNNNG